MQQRAEEHGFIGLCIEGTGDYNSHSWNAAGCCGAAVDAQVDDVGFVRGVIAWAKERASVSKVFAIGHSNGAMMSWRLLCEVATDPPPQKKKTHLYPLPSTLPSPVSS